MTIWKGCIGTRTQNSTPSEETAPEKYAGRWRVYRFAHLEAVEELAVDDLETVPGVDDHKAALKHFALPIVGVHEHLPPLHLVHVGKRKAVPRQVDEHQTLGKLEEIELRGRGEKNEESENVCDRSGGQRSGGTCTSCVIPGLSEDLTVVLSVTALIMDDFPTFDLPQKHTSGRPSGGISFMVSAPATNVSLALRVVPIISTM